MLHNNWWKQSSNEIELYTTGNPSLTIARTLTISNDDRSFDYFTSSGCYITEIFILRMSLRQTIHPSDPRSNLPIGFTQNYKNT